MKKWIVLLAALVLLAGFLGYQSNSSEQGTITIKELKFHTSFTPALEEAKTQGKPVFAYFRSETCGWCKKFEEETFTNQSVINVLNENFILVSIDVYKQKNETRNLGVLGTPTSIFLDSEGKEMKRIRGYVETQIFLDTIGDPVFGV